MGGTRSAKPALPPSLAQLPLLCPLLYMAGAQAEICSVLECLEKKKKQTKYLSSKLQSCFSVPKGNSWMCDRKQENDSHNLEKQEVLCCMTDSWGDAAHRSTHTRREPRTTKATTASKFSLVNSGGLLRRLLRSIGEKLLQGLGVTQKQLHHQKPHTNKVPTHKTCSLALSTQLMCSSTASVSVQFG